MKQSIFKQQGLTLSELIIAMALGLFLIGGALMMFLSGKQTFFTNQALSNVQEAGRFAVSLLTEDIQNAGYKGLCLTVPVNHIDSNIIDSIWQQDSFLQGWENSKPTFLAGNIIANTDTLLIQYAGGGAHFSGNIVNVTSENEILFDDANASFTPENSGSSSVLISDGLGCDYFNATAFGGSVSKGDSVAWSHDYNESFELLSLRRILYYLANDNGVPTLYKAQFSNDLTATPFSNEAMIPGISSLKFKFGVIANNEIGDYVEAGSVTNWENVGAIKIFLEATDSADQTKSFEAIISIRNRQQ